MDARELNGTHVGQQIRVDYGNPADGADIIRGTLQSVSHEVKGTELVIAVGGSRDGGGQVTLSRAQGLTVRSER